METINRALLSYGVNALWQIPLVAAAAALAAQFLVTLLRDMSMPSGAPP